MPKAPLLGPDVKLGPRCSHCGELTILFQQTPVAGKPGRMEQHFRCVDCGRETQLVAAVFDQAGEQPQTR